MQHPSPAVDGPVDPRVVPVDGDRRVGATRPCKEFAVRDPRTMTHFRVGDALGVQHGLRCLAPGPRHAFREHHSQTIGAPRVGYIEILSRATTPRRRLPGQFKNRGIDLEGSLL